MLTDPWPPEELEDWDDDPELQETQKEMHENANAKPDNRMNRFIVSPV